LKHLKIEKGHLSFKKETGWPGKGMAVRNKRAHRALGRSPEEKVKGHSGAIYRGPLKLSTKYW